jgi:hypothetical protein
MGGSFLEHLLRDDDGDSGGATYHMDMRHEHVQEVEERLAEFSVKTNRDKGHRK